MRVARSWESATGTLMTAGVSDSPFVNLATFVVGYPWIWGTGRGRGRGRGAVVAPESGCIPVARCREQAWVMRSIQRMIHGWVSSPGLPRRERAAARVRGRLLGDPSFLQNAGDGVNRNLGDSRGGGARCTEAKGHLEADPVRGSACRPRHCATPRNAPAPGTIRARPLECGARHRFGFVASAQPLRRSLDFGRTAARADSSPSNSRPVLRPKARGRSQRRREGAKLVSMHIPSADSDDRATRIFLRTIEGSVAIPRRGIPMPRATACPAGSKPSRNPTPRNP